MCQNSGFRQKEIGQQGVNMSEMENPIPEVINQEIGTAENDTVQEKVASEPKSPASGQYFKMKIVHTNETHICRSENCGLAKGDYVIAQSRYGKDLAKILGIIKDTDILDEEELAEIISSATEEDLRRFRDNIDREAAAMKTCKEKIAKHNLEMKLVSTHYLEDDTKVLFFFTAESRVDFRALVKDLVSVFKMRIELRQIGVRDESRVIGGVAVCGRTYCCHGLTDKLMPVSIKMAKEQNLSLNSMKISGPCGRLLCCLSYEYDYYKEEKSKLPAEGSKVPFKDEYYRVTEVNILSKKIQVTGSDGQYLYLPFENFKYSSENGKWRIISLGEDE